MHQNDGENIVNLSGPAAALCVCVCACVSQEVCLDLNLLSSRDSIAETRLAEIPADNSAATPLLKNSSWNRLAARNCSARVAAALRIFSQQERAWRKA